MAYKDVELSTWMLNWLVLCRAHSQPTVKLCWTTLHQILTEQGYSPWKQSMVASGSWFAWSLHISNEAVRIAIDLRLGLNLCEPHSCRCGGAADAKGINGLSCKHSSGRSIRHQQINDLVWHALRRADTPSVKEPSGLLPGEDKHRDELTLVPWQGGRFLAWDTMVVDTLAPFYVAISAQVTGSAVQAAADRKVSKYASLSASHLFVPIVIETLGPINKAGHSFLSELGRRLSTISDDPRESFSFFSSASLFLYRGLMRSHLEALST